jgi:hypothetical protein
MKLVIHHFSIATPAILKKRSNSINEGSRNPSSYCEMLAA